MAMPTFAQSLSLNLVSFNATASMGDDFSAIASWASIFTEPKHLALTVGKHYWDERKAIKSDIASLKSDW